MTADSTTPTTPMDVLEPLRAAPARHLTDLMEGAAVTGSVVKNGRGKKVRVYKMKPKKGYQRLQGHRQPYTKVQIESIA